jgi:hypothetical protein
MLELLISEVLASVKEVEKKLPEHCSVHQDRIRYTTEGSFANLKIIIKPTW